MLTVKQIAAECGVSTQTARRALKDVEPRDRQGRTHFYDSDVVDDVKQRLDTAKNGRGRSRGRQRGPGRPRRTPEAGLTEIERWLLGKLKTAEKRDRQLITDVLSVLKS